MDAGESENAKEDPGTGRKGKAGDQNPAKNSKRNGKAERQKGAPKAKDSQASWVKKGEADGSEEEQRPDEPQRKGRAKAKSKAEAHGEGKKESWKEKPAEAGKGRKRQEGRSHGGAGNGEAGAENSLPSGGALLSLLKANPPSVTRYTREELLAIGQLPGSKVKPSTLDPILDKENGASPIVMRVKVDKASRRHRGEGEEDDYDEEAAGAGRRERRQNRRGEHDEEDHGDRHRNYNKWGEEQQRGGPQQWWQEEELQQRGPPQAPGKGGRYDEDHRRDVGDYRQPEDQWAVPAAKAKGGDGWDMPDSGSNQNDMDFFTLGDIRQADKAISKGMSMSDYKASLRADNRPRADQPLEPLEEARGSGGKDRSAKDGERNALGRRGDTSGSFGSPFGGPSSGGFFAEEDEDVSQASRGFGKWFGRGTAGKGKAGNGSDDLWDMPALPASATASMALPPGMLPQDKSKPSPSMSSHQPPRSPEVRPVGISSIERLLQESPGSTRDADAFKLGEAFGQGEGSQQGKSILSMIGRTEPEPAADGLDPAKQGKLSVAELFHLAQGKELPSMPTMNSNHKAGGGGEESAEATRQREVLAMASNFMWLAQATKAGQPSVPPGSRFPGYQQRTPAPYGAMGPAGYGMPHPGATSTPAGMMAHGSAREQQLYAEAYAQAMAVGKGAGFSGGHRGPKGAQASWPSSPGPQGYPPAYGAGYGSQLYGGYPVQDYSHLSRGMGGFDGSNAPQGYNAQLAAMHRGYVDQGIQEGFQNHKGSLLEKGGHLLPQSQATSAGAPLATAAASAQADAGNGAQLVADKSAKEANGEDDDGCAQS